MKKQNKTGSKEELIDACKTIKNYMLDFMLGKIDNNTFLDVFFELEAFLLEREYDIDCNINEGIMSLLEDFKNGN